jgi:shikimate dehydrogenase
VVPGAPGGLLTGTTTSRAAVFGHPVAHSLSPVLHRAAYAALGLVGWDYGMADVDAPDLRAVVAGLDESWVGLSLTMPLKEAALELAAEASSLAAGASSLARRVGAANTLVRRGTRWYADNTDVHGIRTSIEPQLRDPLRSGSAPLVIGGGATARAALVALAQLGAEQVVLMTRNGARAATVALAQDLGVQVRDVPMGHWPIDPPIVISTVPHAALAEHCDALPHGVHVVLDAVYGTGSGPLLRRARTVGAAAVPGTDMLLHQAAEQVRLMTGRPAPLEPMRSALEAELASRARMAVDNPDGGGGHR